MRTLVLSDLHLGCGPDPGIFASAHSLLETLDVLASEPLRVVLNGDTFDFSAQEAGGDVADALARDPTNAPVLSAFGRVVEHDGELLLRSGTHDPQLARADVQAHVVRALRVSPAAARRVSFHAASPPTRYRLGGAQVLICHALCDAPPVECGPAHELVNPLRRQFGAGLPDLLRPHPVAAALSALAVNPTAVKQVLSGLSDAGRRVLPWLRASDLYAHAELSGREEEVLNASLDPDVALGATAFDDDTLRRARIKLLRVALGENAFAGPHPRDLTDREWTGVRALSRLTGARAVIGGHTHASAWRAADGLVACDTGAWTWLARVPAAEGGDEAWQAYLDQWQHAPRIDARLSRPPPTHLRFTAALIAARRRGASVALVEWRAGALTVLCEQFVPASP